MRRLLLVFLVALAMAGPSSSAAVPTPDFIRAVRADYELRLALGEFRENETLAERPQDPCTMDHFTVNQAAREIAFNESRTEGECGEIGHLTSLPDASQVFVVFNATRTIYQEIDQASTPVDAVQELRLYDASGRLVGTYAYVSPSSGNVVDQLFFYELQPFGKRVLNLSWYFEDRGYSPGTGLPNVPVGQRFEASVVDPRLLIRGALLPSSQLGTNENIVGDMVVNRTFVQVNLQSVVREGASNFTLRVVTNPDAALEEIRTPSGEALDLSRLASRQQDDGFEVQINQADLEGRGLGNLIFVFRTESAVPPAPAPPPPAGPQNIYPLALLLLALPAVPAAFATRSSLGMRRSADARHRPFVTHVFGVDLAFLAIYVGLFVYVVTGSQLPRMAALPLTLEGWVLYFEFVLLTLLFVFLWVAPTRHLVVLMRRDLIMSEKAQAQLRRSNAELEQFAYIASHDLQEPLRTIAGFSEILRTRYGKQLDAKAQQYLAMNAAGAKRMQTLIHGLLAYSRVEAEPLKKVPVDLRQVLADVARDVERLRRDVKGNIEVGKVPVVRADPVQMRQLFLNLVQNALKYRHPERAPRIVIGSERDNDHDILFVRDNGRGIDPKFHEQIFDMFQRLESRDSKIEGTGLGLAVVKKIVARHDGRVWVENVPGGGSIFKVALPR